MNRKIGMGIARALALEGWSENILRSSRTALLSAYDEYVNLRCDSTSGVDQLEFDLEDPPQESLDATA